MKKLLALVLTLTLVFGTFSFAAAAPADVVGTDYEDAATRLGALGVMIGDERGFRPNDSITRAEFAVLVVRALGLESAAKFSTSPTKFADVTDAYNWAWGYINVAVEQGVIKGYSETAFGPGDAVTYEQAIAMIVRSLGYEPAVVGGYPAGFLAKAAELDITDDVTVVTGAGAPRGAVAQMLNNALEVDLMERKTFGDEANYEAVDKNLLEDKLGVKVITGEVTDGDDEEVTIDDGTTEDDYELAEGLDATNLVGITVEAWKYDGKIVYMTEDSDVYYAVITKMEDANDEIDTLAAPYNNLYKITLSTGKTLKTADTYYVFVDGAQTAALADDMFAKVVADDGKVVRIEAYDLDGVENGIVEEVDEDYVVYTVGDDDGNKFRIEDYDKLMVVVNGKLADYEDLEEGMVFSAVEYTADEYVIAATDKKVEGELERYKSGEAKIAGEYYDFSAYADPYLSTDDGEEYAAYTTDTMDDLLEEEVVAYFDIAGDLAYIKGEVEEDTSSFFAYVVKGWASEYDYVKLFTEKGETVTYKVDVDEVDVDDDGVLGDEIVEDVIYEFEVDEDGFVVGVTSYTSLTIAAGDVDSFSDTYDTIKIDDDGTGPNPAAIYYVTDSTVIFDTSDTDDLKVVAWDDIKDTDKVDTLAGVMEHDSKNKVKYVAFDAGLEDLGADDNYFAFVLDKAKVGSSDYELEMDLGDDKATVVFDEGDLGGADEEDIIIYTLNTDETGDVEAVAASWDNMAALEIDSDYAAGDFTLANDDDVDGSYIYDGTNWYKVASDAIIYEAVYDDGYDFEKADLDDIDAGDDVSFLTVNDVIKILFFEKN